MRGLGQEYTKAEASGGDFERLPAGGYICRIIKAEDHGSEQRPYLRILYDIAEGPYAGFYSDDWGKANEWAHDSRHYYTTAALGMFKGFLKAVDESNGTNFEPAAEMGFDERKLAGCLVGYIIGEEEYEGNDGTVKTRLKVRSSKPVQAIREGRFKQPEIKRLAGTNPDPEIPPEPAINEDDLPF